MVCFHLLSPKEREIEKARQIAATVARAHGFDLALLRCSCRRRDLVAARRDVAAEIYRQTTVTVSEIGRILNRSPAPTRRGLVASGLM